MGLQKLIPTSIRKLAPSSRGILQNSVTGVGDHAVLQIDDSFISSPLQSFGVVLPFLGIRVSLIDAINFMVHSKGKIGISKSGIIAVLASKVAQGAVNLGGVSALSTTGSLTGSPGASAGIPGGGL